MQLFSVTARGEACLYFKYSIDESRCKCMHTKFQNLGNFPIEKSSLNSPDESIIFSGAAFLG